jgi:hypothetical protein
LRSQFKTVSYFTLYNLNCVYRSKAFLFLTLVSTSSLVGIFNFFYQDIQWILLNLLYIVIFIVQRFLFWAHLPNCHLILPFQKHVKSSVSNSAIPYLSTTFSLRSHISFDLTFGFFIYLETKFYFNPSEKTHYIFLSAFHCTISSFLNKLFLETFTNYLYWMSLHHILS